MQNSLDYSAMDMLLSDFKKKEVIKEFQIHDKDTCSADVQIGLLTEKATEISNYLNINPKDHGARLVLIKTVGERRKLLDYLNATNFKRYIEVLKKLNIKR